MIRYNRDEEIGGAHAGEDQSRQCAERPERHFDFAIRLFCVLHGKVNAYPAKDQCYDRQNAENGEEYIIRQRSTCLLLHEGTLSLAGAQEDEGFHRAHACLRQAGRSH